MSQNRYYSSTAQATTLNGGINGSATTIVVNATTGFPGSFPYTLILDRDTVNEEVVKVTAAASTSLTVVRAQDGTSGVSHANGASVQHGVSAQDFNEPQAHIAATSGVHGVTGSLVGTTDTQTLTNKTLTSPTINSPAVSSPTINGATSIGAGATLTSPTINGATIDAATTHGGVSGTTLATDHAAWTTYTPTLTNVTGGTASGAYLQMGKTLFLRVNITAGTAAATTFVTASLPLSLTVKTSAQYLAGNTNGAAGSYWFGAAAGSTISTSATITSGTSMAASGFTGVIEVA